MNNTPPKNNDVVLNFLTDGLPSKEGSLVVQAYFEVGSGVPNSAPVSAAILLAACTRKMAGIPSAMSELVKEFCVVEGNARKLQEESFWRINREVEKLVTDFRSEATRSSNVIIKAVELTQTQLKEANQTTQKITSEAQEIKTSLNSLKAGLIELTLDLSQLQRQSKLQNESTAQIAEATQTIKAIQEENQKLVKHLTKQASIHWLTVGYIAGAITLGVSMQFSPWIGLGLFAVGTGLLQWLFRAGWKYFFEQSQKLN